MKQQSVQSVATAAADIFLRALTRSPFPLSIDPAPPEREQIGATAAVCATAICLLSAYALVATRRAKR
jgi:hypothetical protein